MHDRFFLIQNHYDLQIVSIKESAVFVKKRRCLLFELANSDRFIHFMNDYHKGGLTLSIQFLQQLAQSTDKEIVAIAREEGFDITTSEVKKLRPYLEQFSFSWLFLGIPKDILVEVEAVLGRKRSRQLIALFTK